MKEMTLTFKNVMLKCDVEDRSASFKVCAGGDIKVTADPTMLSAIAEFLEKEEKSYED